MISKSPLRFAIPFVIVEFSILVAGYWMLGDFDIHRFNVWPISEWMINYQAEFVRRGLVGEVLHRLNIVGGVIPILYPLVFIFYCAYIAIFIFNFIISKIRSSTILTLSLLIPGGILHMAMGPYFYTRKEILFLIHFGLLCLIYLKVGRASFKKKPLLIGVFGFIAVVGGILLTLVHEPYLFMAYPITLLLCIIYSRENKNFPVSRLIMISYALIIPIIFLVCSLNHGDQFISQRIWDSYQLSDRLILAPVAPYTASLSTAALGWGFMQHLSTIYGVFITGTWIYWALFWLANGLVVLYIASRISSIGSTSEILDPSDITSSSVKATYVITVGFGFLISSSMFFIAADYGRWIACSTNLSLLFSFAMYQSPYINRISAQLNYRALQAGKQFIALSKITPILIVILMYELTFQMPECCIRGSEFFIRYDKFIKLFISESIN